ncbi:hypothetical protein BT93_K1940 [Corymbia citriodora subsp. variegata]|nr:hypothetical protein BT93_K1940 [Corymbia citriodora subsp. variegata]
MVNLLPLFLLLSQATGRDFLLLGLGLVWLRQPLKDNDFRRMLLEGGPMTVARVPLTLQQWHPLLELGKDQHFSVPVWVHLKNIPYALWSAPGISAVASILGKPLYIDQRTEQMKMISFARVCVEIEANSEQGDSVEVILNGATRRVDVEYEWRLESCSSYGTFGYKCQPKDGHLGGVHPAFSGPE